MADIAEKQQQAIQMWQAIQKSRKSKQEALDVGDYQEVERITGDLVFWELKMKRLRQEIGLFALFYDDDQQDRKTAFEEAVHTGD